MTRLAPTQVSLEFAITGEEIALAEERAFRRLVQNVRLPGFRKGKVPRKIFEQTYGSQAVTSEAVDEVVPEAYGRAIREHDLDPVDKPKLEVLEQSEGRPTRLRATVEVRPPIELGRYKGIVVPKPPISVSDSDVERSLQALAKERATLVPVGRAAALGDVATLDYRGTIDGVPFTGGEASGQAIELSEGRFVPGFVDGIVGMLPGESREVKVRFPDEYPSPDLAGKDAVFTITLHELKEYELPPLDDALARAVSANETLEELRGDLRRRLEAVAGAKEHRAIGNAVVAQMLATHDFPLPPSMVEAEIDRLVADAPSPPGERSEGELRESYRAEAESLVKTTLLIEQVAKVEKIVATPADIAAELEVLARRYGQPAARLRKALGNNLLSLMDGVVRTKTLDFLIDNAEVVENHENKRSAS